jgi:ferredoxin
MTDVRNGKGYILPRLLDGCTGCRACAEVCPDFVFEVYRFGGIADVITEGEMNEIGA